MDPMLRHIAIIAIVIIAGVAFLLPQVYKSWKANLIKAISDLIATAQGGASALTGSQQGTGSAVADPEARDREIFSLWQQTRQSLLSRGMDQAKVAQVSGIIVNELANPAKAVATP